VIRTEPHTTAITRQWVPAIPGDGRRFGRNLAEYWESAWECKNTPVDGEAVMSGHANFRGLRDRGYAVSVRVCGSPSGGVGGRVPQRAKYLRLSGRRDESYREVPLVE
jgi:hypothetical protein